MHIGKLKKLMCVILILGPLLVPTVYIIYIYINLTNHLENYRLTFLKSQLGLRSQ